MTFFISDLHLGHKNCLSFDNRPFSTIEEQDVAIKYRWNKAVSANDTVWILGDVSWYNSDKTSMILNELNGTKNLCIGNHDGKLLDSKKFRDCFNEICNYKELYLGDSGVVLCHYPIVCFNKHFYGWKHLYGHVHSSFEWNIVERVKNEMKSLYDKPCKMFNVGCMMNYIDYTPRTLEDICTNE